MSLLLKNGNTLLDNKIQTTSVYCKDGFITSFDKHECHLSDDCIDCTGLYVFPGFIDCHIHGGGGGDSCNQTLESYSKIATSQLKHGTTSIVLAIGGMPDDFIHTSSSLICEVNSQSKGATILGFHLEGP